MTLDDPPVMVIGAGPVGLVAACELLRHGVGVRVVDKRTEPTDQSRALAVNARTLDMLDRMGLVEQLIDTGVKSHGMQIYADGEKLFRVPFSEVDAAFPYTLITPQTETERLLTERLHALGGRIERGVELTTLRQDPLAAHLVLAHREEGVAEAVEAPWVIGADGAHSTVRRLVGLPLDGTFAGVRFVFGDVDADHPLDDTEFHNFLSPHGPVVAMAMPGGRFRFIAEIHDPAGVPQDMHPTQAQLQMILDQRVGDVQIRKSHWLSAFEVRYGQVPQYRVGRVFLAGDAAHIHSPLGGQGMNTGMQDAFNLGWKLAMHLRGEGGQQLLDSYHGERHPIAGEVISFTDTLTKVATARGTARVIRNAALSVVGHIPAVGRKVGDIVEEMTVNYHSSPVVIQGPRRAKVAAGEHFPFIADAAVRTQLTVLLGPDNTRHTVLRIPAGPRAPDAGPYPARDILVTSKPGASCDEHAVVVDPGASIATRCGVHGGLIVIRPDGYIGAVDTDHHTTNTTLYFHQISRDDAQP